MLSYQYRDHIKTFHDLLIFITGIAKPGPIFCLLLRVSSDYAQPITSQVTEVSCPVIGRAQPRKDSLHIETVFILRRDPGGRLNIKMSSYQYRIPMLKIRWSHNCLIFNMEIPIPGKRKDGLYIETGAWSSYLHLQGLVNLVDMAQLAQLGLQLKLTLS